MENEKKTLNFWVLNFVMMEKLEKPKLETEAL